MACRVCNRCLSFGEMSLIGLHDNILRNIQQCMLSEILQEDKEFLLCKSCRTAIYNCTMNIFFMRWRSRLGHKPGIRCQVCQGSESLMEIFVDENSNKYGILIGLTGDYVQMPTWICNACGDLLKDLDQLHQSVSNTTAELQEASKFEEQLGGHRMVSHPIPISNPRQRFPLFDLSWDSECGKEHQPATVKPEDPFFIPPSSPYEKLQFRLELGDKSIKTEDCETCSTSDSIKTIDLQQEQNLRTASQLSTDESQKESGWCNINNFTEVIPQSKLNNRSSNEPLIDKNDKLKQASGENAQEAFKYTEGRSPWQRPRGWEEDTEVIKPLLNSQQDDSLYSDSQRWGNDNVQFTERISNDKSEKHTELGQDNTLKLSKSFSRVTVNKSYEQENGNKQTEHGHLLGELITGERISAKATAREVANEPFLSEDVSATDTATAGMCDLTGRNILYYVPRILLEGADEEPIDNLCNNGDEEQEDNSETDSLIELSNKMAKEAKAKAKASADEIKIEIDVFVTNSDENANLEIQNPSITPKSPHKPTDNDFSAPRSSNATPPRSSSETPPLYNIIVKLCTFTHFFYVLCTFVLIVYLLDKYII